MKVSYEPHITGVFYESRMILIVYQRKVINADESGSHDTTKRLNQQEDSCKKGKLGGGRWTRDATC